jgi:hypothetical protein
MEQNTPRNAANDMPFQAGNSRAVGGEQVSVTAVLTAAARAKSGPVERFESQKPAAPTTGFSFMRWPTISAISCVALRICLPVALSALVASTAIAVFYALEGTMYFRWAYATLPPLLLVLGVLALAIAERLPPPRRRALEVVCIALACAQLIYAVVKDGPFS